MTEHRQKGFTLVELVVVVAIFGIVFIVVSNTFFNSIKAALKAEAIKEVRQNGDVAMARIVNDVRDANEYICWVDNQERVVLVLYSETNRDRVTYRWTKSTNTPSELSLVRIAVVDGINQSSDYVLDRQSVLLSDPAKINEVFGCYTGLSTPNPYTYQKSSPRSSKPLVIDFTLRYAPFGNTAILSNLKSEERVEMKFRTSVAPRIRN